jgi:hypothetical protein
MYRSKLSHVLTEIPHKLRYLRKSRGSSAGIATGCGLDDQGLKFESLQGQEYLLLHIVQTGSGVRPTSYTMDTGSSLPICKQAAA